MKPQFFARVRAHKQLAFLGICAALAFAFMFALSACSSGATSSSAASASADAAASSAGAADASSISVTINVDSSAADGSADGSETVSLPEGANVLDAMEASSFDCVVQDSEWGAYIDSIGGIATGDYGGMSGWIYTVNSETITVSSDECILADGDVIDWVYVTDFS